MLKVTAYSICQEQIQMLLEYIHTTPLSHPSIVHLVSPSETVSLLNSSLLYVCTIFTVKPSSKIIVAVYISCY